MGAIPATPQHYLPLVTVDYLVKVMALAATENSLAQRELLVAHQQRFVLAEMFNIIATQVNQQAPTLCAFSCLKSDTKMEMAGSAVRDV